MKGKSLLPSSQCQEELLALVRVGALQWQLSVLIHVHSRRFRLLFRYRSNIYIYLQPRSSEVTAHCTSAGNDFENWRKYFQISAPLPERCWPLDRPPAAHDQITAEGKFSVSFVLYGTLAQFIVSGGRPRKVRPLGMVGKQDRIRN